MTVRILTHDDVAALLTMDDCIAAMERAFIDLANGHYYLPLRLKARPEGQPNRMGFMPALRTKGRRLWSVKEICVTPANGERGIDPHQGAVILHDGDDGRPLAVVDASAITAVRTAAVTAVATRALAPATVRRVAIVGAGVQGRSHVQAMRCILPDAEMVVWSRNPSRARALAEAADCAVAKTVREAVSNAKVVCTVTGSYVPILKREWLAPGCHINAVGSSLAAARELDGPTIKAGSLFVDRRESTVNEAGEYLFALKEGHITPDHIKAELGEVLTGVHPGRTGADEFTIFKSLGLAVQDLVTAELVLERAEREGVGLVVAW